MHISNQQHQVGSVGSRGSKEMYVRMSTNEKLARKQMLHNVMYESQL